MNPQRQKKMYQTRRSPLCIGYKRTIEETVS